MATVERPPWEGAKRAEGEGPCNNCGHEDLHYIAAGQDICTHEGGCECECYSTGEKKPAEPAGKYIGLHRPVTRRMMLPFERKEDFGGEIFGWRRLYLAQPQVPFKPRGLMIWGAPDDADVTQIWIGRNLQVVAALGPIPAKWFSMAQSYEQVERLLKEGIEPPSWPDFNVVMIAQYVEVHIASKEKLTDNTKIVMWGFGIQ